jgi:hypothetical protein
MLASFNIIGLLMLSNPALEGREKELGEGMLKKEEGGIEKQKENLVYF